MSKKELTKEMVYAKLVRLDPEKYTDLPLESILITETGSVRVNGKFVKGYSGNTKGKAPNKKPIIRSDLPKVDKDIFKADSKKAMEYLLESAQTRAEAKQIAKELLPYQYPKLANIESRSFQEKTITIHWVTEDQELIDITPEDYQKQLEAAEILHPEIKEAVIEEVSNEEGDHTL